VRRVYLYTGDLFKPLDLPWEELEELREDPRRLLDTLRPHIEELLDCSVRELKLFKAMTAGGETVVEYLAALEGPAVSGEASVKLIHSPNPVEALRKYYEWEKQTTGGE